MSHDHLNNSGNTSFSDLHPEDDKNKFYDYQINNMYDQEKHVNAHDIGGQQGLVMS